LKEGVNYVAVFDQSNRRKISITRREDYSKEFERLKEVAGRYGRATGCPKSDSSFNYFLRDRKQNCFIRLRRRPRLGAVTPACTRRFIEDRHFGVQARPWPWGSIKRFDREVL
jgi:hypothetical protein